MTQTANNILNYTHLKTQYIFKKNSIVAMKVLHFQVSNFFFRKTLTGFFDRGFVCCLAA